MNKFVIYIFNSFDVKQYFTSYVAQDMLIVRYSMNADEAVKFKTPSDAKKKAYQLNLYNYKIVQI